MRLFDRIKSKISARSATTKSGQSYQSIMATLVAVQLSTSFENPSKSFPTFMTDTKAAGYLFGFHQAYAQYVFGSDADKCFPEIKASYAGLFGQSAGNLLLAKAAVDLQSPEFEAGRLQGGNEMQAYMERSVHPFGLMNYLVFDRTRIGHPDNPISKFEKAILTWDYEQARLAAALLAAIVKGDNVPIESMFGKGVTVQTALGHLTVGHMRVLQSTLEEIAPEVFDGFTTDNEEEDEDD